MGRNTNWMGSTQVSAARSIAEIKGLLAQTGMLRNCLDEYGDDGKLSGMKFTLQMPDGSMIPYQLPFKVHRVVQVLQEARSFRTRGKQPGLDTDRAKAEKIAARQAFRWLQAQIGYAETGQVEIREILMSYMLVGPERDATLFEVLHLRGDGQGIRKLLSLPEPTIFESEDEVHDVEVAHG